MAERFCNYCRMETKTVDEDCVDCGLSKPHHTVIVTATKEQLHEIGICSDHTFKWLMNGEPKIVKSINWNAYGRRMFYLRHPDDNDISHWDGWVYEDMCECEVEKFVRSRMAEEFTNKLEEDDRNTVIELGG